MVVGGMCFAGKDNLYRPVLVRNDRAKSLRVAKKQVRTLVPGETAREADCENIVTENSLDFTDPLSICLLNRIPTS